MSLVTGIWAENGNRGFLDLTILTGHDETDIECHGYYLNRQQTGEIAAAMCQALAKGLGEPKPNLNDGSPCEDFMEQSVIFRFPKEIIDIGKPSDWKLVRRIGAVIGITTHFKVPVEIGFATEVTAKQALDRLLDNHLHIIELDSEVTRMMVCDGKSLRAQGLTTQETDVLNARFRRLSDWKWRVRGMV